MKTSLPLPVRARRVPLWLKLTYTAFLAVLIPVYWINYGPTNFLYFCDVALLLTLAALWSESALLASIPAVGILLPQALWCIDFTVHLLGGRMTGLTDYMFDPQRSLFLRGLSLFHGWLPFLLFYLVRTLGYDRRAFLTWTTLCVTLCLIAFFFLPAPGAVLSNPKIPRNINYVFGLDDTAPQHLLPAPVYLAAWLAVLIGVVHLPTHFLLRKTCPAGASAAKTPRTAFHPTAHDVRGIRHARHRPGGPRSRGKAPRDRSAALPFAAGDERKPACRHRSASPPRFSLPCSARAVRPHRRFRTRSSTRSTAS